MTLNALHDTVIGKEIMEDIVLYKKPKLKKPYLVAGFGRWPNAGEISTLATSYLKNKLEAKRFGEISPEEFCDFSTLHPSTIVESEYLDEQVDISR